MVPVQGEERSLAVRLRSARMRRFAGRTAERELFAGALAASPAAAFVVLWVSGPPGIGKTALLEAFAEDARGAGRPVVSVNGRGAGPSRELFLDREAEIAAGETTVLLVDEVAWDEQLEDWFRQKFVPSLPADVLVVIAHRLPPDPGWRADLAWTELLRVISLRNLPPDVAEELLRARGVGDSCREPILAFAGGHPLALSLAAEVAVDGRRLTRSMRPSHDVVRTLLSTLVGSVPSARHRLALEICAHAYDTTEELLRAVLGSATESADLFAWLRLQPFIEYGDRGLYPHDVVRDALDVDLRWRDATGYESVHRKLKAHLLEKIRAAEGMAALEELRALAYLHRTSPVMQRYLSWERGDLGTELPIDGQDDVRAVLELGARSLGEAALPALKYWLERQPQAFSVYRSPGSPTPTAFVAKLRLEEPRADDLAADAVVATAWQHSRAAGPVRGGEHLTVVRYFVLAPECELPCGTGDLMQMRLIHEWIKGERLAWTYVAVTDVDRWREQLEYLDHDQVSGGAVTLFAHDWRAVPVELWLDRYVNHELFGAELEQSVPSDNLTVLSREDFDAAVRRALRAWRRTDQLTANPLIRSRLVAESKNADPVQGLREVIGAAAKVLDGDARTQHLYRAVATTYLRGVPTQEVAAERLDLPLSTYRRHLTRGLEEICGILWNRELYGAG
ncbi:ATP-binding protein [Kribbella sandramycini]